MLAKPKSSGALPKIEIPRLGTNSTLANPLLRIETPLLGID
jgi:hypothetical protein